MLSARVHRVAVARCSQADNQEYRLHVNEVDLLATRALCQERFDTIAPIICEVFSGMCGCSGNSHGALIFSSLRL